MATTTERHLAAPREHGGNPVWRKAPVSLLRHPSLFAALALGAFLVVVSTVAYPLFLSASGSALVASEIDNPTVTRFGAGIIYTSTNVPFDKASPDGHGLLSDRRREVFSQTVGMNPSVDPVIEQAMGYEIAVTGPDGHVPSSGPVNGVLFFGTDVLDHVDIVEGTDGTGVWLPDYVAEPLDAAVHSIHSPNAGVRGLAVEYLDQVLPPAVAGRFRQMMASTESDADAPER